MILIVYCYGCRRAIQLGDGYETDRAGNRYHITCHRNNIVVKPWGTRRI